MTRCLRDPARVERAPRIYNKDKSRRGVKNILELLSPGSGVARLGEFDLFIARDLNLIDQFEECPGRPRQGRVFWNHDDGFQNKRSLGDFNGT